MESYTTYFTPLPANYLSDLNQGMIDASFEQAAIAAGYPTKRFNVVIERGRIVHRAEITLNATDIDTAEALGAVLLDRIDPSAYVDSVYEVA